MPRAQLAAPPVRTSSSAIATAADLAGVDQGKDLELAPPAPVTDCAPRLASVQAKASTSSSAIARGLGGALVDACARRAGRGA